MVWPLSVALCLFSTTSLLLPPHSLYSSYTGLPSCPLTLHLRASCMAYSLPSLRTSFAFPRYLHNFPPHLFQNAVLSLLQLKQQPRHYCCLIFYSISHYMNQYWLFHLLLIGFLESMKLRFNMALSVSPAVISGM